MTRGGADRSAGRNPVRGRAGRGSADPTAEWAAAGAGRGGRPPRGGAGGGRPGASGRGRRGAGGRGEGGACGGAAGGCSGGGAARPAGGGGNRGPGGGRGARRHPPPPVSVIVNPNA